MFIGQIKLDISGESSVERFHPKIKSLKQAYFESLDFRNRSKPHET